MGLLGGFFKKINQMITGHTPVDEAFFDSLEEQLILADVGVSTAMRLTEALREKSKEEKWTEAGQLREAMEAAVAEILTAGEHAPCLEKGRLNVILLVGVNGVGKTTSLGKLAYRLKEEGWRVLAAAADTFRAGAVDQLEVWCRRCGIDLVRHQEGSDPGAVVFDAIQAANARKMDVLLVDTAGRLQNKVNLMEELKKIRRVIQRELPDQPGEVLLVLDAATGQNALSQAELFREAAQVTGVILTKMDGTAKGGVVLGVQSEYGLPVKWVGTGEQIGQLEVFDAEGFSRALFEE
ncbi:MAG: signal recognition particle-docking protein FtsY [Peptococcaceae bacterium]|jgi:fused signal recognition particle receptor|nr:signal recognition particle-docking protein FtsY [Peptococcaceae bacterium]